jgi:hypothetical protein
MKTDSERAQIRLELKARVFALFDEYVERLKDTGPAPEVQEWGIPVVFNAYGHDDAEAASSLVRLLADANLLIGDTDENQLVTSWWLPNHPQADGSDSDQPRLHWSNQCKDVGDEIARQMRSEAIDPALVHEAARWAGFINPEEPA